MFGIRSLELKQITGKFWYFILEKKNERWKFEEIYWDWTNLREKPYPKKDIEYLVGIVSFYSQYFGPKNERLERHNRLNLGLGTGSFC